MLSDLPASVTVLFQSILAIVAIVLAVAVWRWLRVALNNGALAGENQALAQIAAYASVFVAAADQMMQSATGPQKLDWVLVQLGRVLPDLDADLVRSYVEAAVAALPRNQPVNCDTLAPVQPASAPAAISHSKRENKGVRLPGAA